MLSFLFLMLFWMLLCWVSWGKIPLSPSFTGEAYFRSNLSINSKFQN